jgi:hypothetical protein
MLPGERFFGFPHSEEINNPKQRRCGERQERGRAGVESTRTLKDIVRRKRLVPYCLQEVHALGLPCSACTGPLWPAMRNREGSP